MTNQTQHKCNRRHMDLPANFQIARCVHGRIGVNDYCVAEAFDPAEPNHGVFLYSVVPSGIVYTLVCMWGYQDAEQRVRDSVYDWFWGQMKYGKLPIDYIMHTERDNILTVRHSPESQDIMTAYSLSMGSPVPLRAALLFGRPAVNTALN